MIIINRTILVLGTSTSICINLKWRGGRNDVISPEFSISPEIFRGPGVQGIGAPAPRPNWRAIDTLAHYHKRTLAPDRSIVAELDGIAAELSWNNFLYV